MGLTTYPTDPRKGWSPSDVLRDSSTEESFLRLLHGNSLGTAALLVYELLVTFDYEYELVWKKPNKSVIKWLFLFIRYFALASQIGLQTMADRVALNVPVPLRHCKLVFMWPLVACQFMLTSVELVLIHRVQALYPSRPMYLIFGSFILAEVVVLGINAIVELPNLKFNALCMTTTPPASIIVYGVIAITSQSIILYLTIRKHIIASRSGWSRTPIVSLLIRDGAVAYAVIFALQIVTMVYLITGGFAFVQYWLMGILSCVGCRLIINLQRLGEPDDREESAPSPPIELTTRITDSHFASSIDEF